MPIENIRVKNFKSIRDSGDIPIGPVNIFVGANGVGKSNFISFLKMLNCLSRKRLGIYVADNGYEDSLLHFGRKNSRSIEGSIVFRTEGENRRAAYDLKLVPRQNASGLYFEKDEARFQASGEPELWQRADLGGRVRWRSGVAQKLRPSCFRCCNDQAPIFEKSGLF